MPILAGTPSWKLQCRRTPPKAETKQQREDSSRLMSVTALLPQWCELPEYKISEGELDAGLEDSS